MTNTLNAAIERLNTLLADSQKKKLLWEEMQIISQKAFDLQDNILAELDKIEQTETDITKIQAAFGAREMIWDIMNQIATRELEIKEKTHRKETPAERAKRHTEAMEPDECDHHCCCGHHHTEEQCCKKQKGKCTCKKK